MLFKQARQSALEHEIRPMNKPLICDSDTLQPLMTGDYLFRIGTAAYQIEGEALAEGRTEKCKNVAP
jgi:hypothetical protein